MSVGAVMTLMLQLSCYCLKHGVLQPIENEFDKWRAAMLTIIGAGNLIMFFFPIWHPLSHHADDALCKLRLLDGGQCSAGK
jgi:hypothetical protein